MNRGGRITSKVAAPRCVGGAVLELMTFVHHEKVTHFTGILSLIE